MAKIQVDTPGQTGVIIDRAPVDGTTPDDTLIQAQNATHDPRLGHLYALTKRPGLAKFHLSTLGGSVLGGIPMPVAGTGGAPSNSSGGGGFAGSDGGTSAAPGTASGAGDGTGAPGGTSSGGGVAYAPVGAALFNGGSKIFSGVRLIVIGRQNNTSSGQVGVGWYVTSQAFANSANSATSPGPPGTVYSYPPTATFRDLWGKPSHFDSTKALLYYGAANNQTGSPPVVASIRKTDGATDNTFASIPSNTSQISGHYAATYDQSTTLANQRNAIMWLSAGPTQLYVCVKDKASGQASDTYAANVGRVYQVNLTDSTLIEVTGSQTSQSPYLFIPFALAYYYRGGAVYWSTLPLTSSEVTQDANAIIHGSNDPGVWHQDASFSGTSFGQFGSCMTVFPVNDPINQLLFMGFGIKQTTPAFPPVVARSRVALGTSGAWTTSIPSTGLGSGGVGGASAANGCYWTSMAEFNGKLYAAFWNSAWTGIFQFTPTLTHTSGLSDGGWDGTGTWSVVWNVTSGGQPIQLFADNNYLYGFSVNTEGTGGLFALWTVDGTTWNTTGSLPNFSDDSHALPIYGAFNQ